MPVKINRDAALLEECIRVAGLGVTEAAVSLNVRLESQSDFSVFVSAVKSFEIKSGLRVTMNISERNSETMMILHAKK